MKLSPLNRTQAVCTQLGEKEYKEYRCYRKVITYFLRKTDFLRIYSNLSYVLFRQQVSYHRLFPSAYWLYSRLLQYLRFHKNSRIVTKRFDSSGYQHRRNQLASQQVSRPVSQPAIESDNCQLLTQSTLSLSHPYNQSTSHLEVNKPFSSLWCNSMT